MPVIQILPLAEIGYPTPHDFTTLIGGWSRTTVHQGKDITNHQAQNFSHMGLKSKSYGTWLGQDQLQVNSDLAKFLIIGKAMWFADTLDSSRDKEWECGFESWMIITITRLTPKSNVSSQFTTCNGVNFNLSEKNLKNIQKPRDIGKR